MYLNQLNYEQKELFLDMCIQASLANNDFAEEQKALIELYCNEMQMSEVRYEAKKKFDEAILELIEISSKAEIKIIVLEILALILSDHKYDDYEQAFMDKVIVTTEISREEFGEMITLLGEMDEIYEKINRLVFIENRYL
ncbi:MAG: hypothetical protein ACRCU3_07910 [Eubacteriaceae bacterium]